MFCGLRQMVPMLVKIALELCERVAKVIDIRVLFRSPVAKVKVRTSEAMEMMKLWKSTYLEIRAKIESTGRDARWEFDQRKLFDKTDFIGGVCKDLASVAQVYTFCLFLYLFLPFDEAIPSVAVFVVVSRSDGRWVDGNKNE